MEEGQTTEEQCRAKVAREYLDHMAAARVVEIELHMKPGEIELIVALGANESFSPTKAKTRGEIGVLSNSTTSAASCSLYREGYIEKLVNPEGRQKNHLMHLTPKGKRAYEQAVGQYKTTLSARKLF